MNQLVSPTRVLALVIASLMCGSFPAGAAQATGNGGTVSGTVVDPDGASVAGAQVILSNAVTGYQQPTKTDSTGAFRLTNIPPNQYHLEVTAPGFMVYTQDIPIHSQVPVQVKAALALAGSTQTVDVHATADVVENVPAAHTDISQNLLQNLPVASSGQGLSDAITLSSGGVVADSNGFFHPQGDHGETTYVVDGQPISDQQNKTFSTQLPTNAFQSLEMVTSAPSAEYGDKTGLIVNTVTRSGLGQKASASLDTYYGSFGTVGEDATFGIGGSKWGNFLVLDSSRSGRFLDSPEFTAFHDKGNTETIFDRADYQPTGKDSFHLDIFAARNWFQIPVTYDQLGQDQRQQAKTLSFSLGYQHTFNPKTLLSISPWVRQDRVNYYPSSDPFNDQPATISQGRHLTNWGTRGDLSYANGMHDIKVGTDIHQTRLIEDFGLALTDPSFNPVCLTSAGDAVTNPSLVNPNMCAGAGFTANPSLQPGLVPFDLTRGGVPLRFHAAHNINQQAVYAQDYLTFKDFTFQIGVRFDNYQGLSSDNLVEPRLGISYLLKATGTVFRGSFTRSMETPYNENLLLSNSTGSGGLGSDLFGPVPDQALRPGHRNQYSVGFEQGINKYLQINGSYFWKYTKNAFDFDTLFNTPIAFPISWRQSNIDGVSFRISTSNLHGLQAYTTFGHTRARFFGPEVGGLIFNSPLNTSVFRIDHDQVFQQTTFLRYQHGKDGLWAMFTWRFDSGEVAGSVTDLSDALALTADEQTAIGFFCGDQRATLAQPITSCSGSYGATRLTIPAPGTFNADHNPPRIAPRNLFDMGVGTDNLFHNEKLKTTLKLAAVNITNEAALYNFLSTFSGTHWVTPRSYTVTLGWVY
ncbi:MAG: TonB-dependent receptor [Acidobacteriota bacterium]|nr:TonB-dependent receptor [Acidobacteriota bacterium]